MSDDVLLTLLPTLQKERETLLQHQQVMREQIQQQAQQLVQIQGQLTAALYLGYALAANHPNPGAVADHYMSLMDQAGDRIPPEVAALLQPHLQTVLHELLKERP